MEAHMEQNTTQCRKIEQKICFSLIMSYPIDLVVLVQQFDFWWTNGYSSWITEIVHSFILMIRSLELIQNETTQLSLIFFHKWYF